MRTRHLQTRFILAGVALVMMTIVSGLWSAWTFARLSTVAGRTIRSSQRTTQRISPPASGATTHTSRKTRSTRPGRHSSASTAGISVDVGSDPSGPAAGFSP